MLCMYTASNEPTQYDEMVISMPQCDDDDDNDAGAILKGTHVSGSGFYLKSQQKYGSYNTN